MARHPAVPSTAAIRGHPLHPMVVPFPIAFLVGVLVADIAYSSGGDPFWSQAAVWLLWGGIVTGLFAGIFGAIDFFTHAQIRSHSAAWIHMLGNLTVLVLSGWNLALRLDETSPPLPEGGLILSAIVAVILLVTGWLGGELAYRYRIGVVRQDAADVKTRERDDVTPHRGHGVTR